MDKSSELSSKLRSLSIVTLAGVTSLGSVLSANAAEPPIEFDNTLSTSYTLSEVSNPSAANNITRNVLDEVSGALTEKHYQINLNKTDYSDGNPVNYFKWEDSNSDGDYEFVRNDQDSHITTTQSRYPISLLDESYYEDITGDFVGQSGSAIFVGGYCGLSDFRADVIESNFIGNSGSAIYLESYVSFPTVIGDFIGNSGSSRGGAVYNGYSSLSSFASNFIGNYVSASSSASGGAIYNGSSIGRITGDFVGNYAKANTGSAYGGAIYNTGASLVISGDFIGNYAKSRKRNS